MDCNVRFELRTKNTLKYLVVVGWIVKRDVFHYEFILKLSRKMHNEILKISKRD